jgi:tetratricopeptide (TPR) repeat protein
MPKLNLPVRIALAGFCCVLAAAIAVIWMLDVDPRKMWGPGPAPAGGGGARPSVAGQASSSDAGKPKRQGEAYIDYGQFEDGGLGIASEFTGAIHDPKSLSELRKAIEARGKVGLAVLQAELDHLNVGPHSSKQQRTEASRLQTNIGQLLMYEGRFEEADAAFEKALELGKSSGISTEGRARLTALRGLVALRQGEVNNCIACVGPSSCIFPIEPAAVHRQQDGSRRAIKYFTEYLDENPGDLRLRWLLNLAYMTLGEYPDKVPRKHLISLDGFRSKIDVGRFENVAQQVGLNSRGPNLAGGSVFDDFTGDNLPDLFCTSLDFDRGASLFVNRGDGTFEDRSSAAGLDDQVYALNVTRADIDNDGDLDVLLLRGAWEKPMRLSLLRNKGDATFEDVTVASGLSEPTSTESAAWGDYDNDGLVDLFVCGEYLPPLGDPATTKPVPGNRCRLYHNRGDGTFENVAAKAGVAGEFCAKGSGWGDYDGDGWIDLFVSNMIGPCRLFHNEGNGTFRDVAPALGVTGAERSFAVWFWDYDNDGRLDLYVNDYVVTLAEVVAIAAGIPVERSSRPRLYRNLGAEGFQEASREVGLDRGMAPMGCNFGDIDNDGFLDIYLGTGGMSYEYLVPKLLLKNVAGRRFEDVTMSSNTGHLQKGHGISFADWDNDGDLDLFLEVGGGVPGDSGYNVLFQNPGHGRHWLKLKLVGTKTNRAALGARIKAVVKDRDGSTRSIYRTVGNNSSFGGNCLTELIGLLDANSVAELEVSWPTSRSTQTFHNVSANQFIVITEGNDTFESLAQPRLKVPDR